MQPKLAAVRAELIASGSTAQVGRPMGVRYHVPAPRRAAPARLRAARRRPRAPASCASGEAGARSRLPRARASRLHHSTFVADDGLVSRAGMVTAILVPFSDGPDRMSHVPPSIRARSAMLCTPIPACVDSADMPNPEPLSSTVKEIASESLSSRTRALERHHCA